MLVNMKNREMYYRALALRRQGLSWHQIAKLLGIPRSTAFVWVGSGRRKGSFGFLSQTSPAKQQLILELLWDGWSSKQIIRVISCSEQTIQKLADLNQIDRSEIRERKTHHIRYHQKRHLIAAGCPWCDSTTDLIESA